MNELVSIVVPVYKVERYLDRCIESIAAQTYSDLEIILVDDGSPDSCPQMCDDWAANDSRIKVIHKENAGIAEARNSGIEAATGSYLMFVDSDDYLSENAVEVLRDRMIKDGSDMVIGKHVDAYDDGTINDSFCKWMKQQVLSSADVFSVIKEHYYTVSVWGKLYKKKVYENCRLPSLTCGEDLWIFPQVVKGCSQISVVNENVYYYYQRADSIVHDKTYQRRKDEIEANLYFTSFLMREGYAKSAAKWFERTIHFLIELRNTQEARRLIAKYFSRIACGKLFLLLSTKTQIKWLSLYVPGMYTVAKKIKEFGSCNCCGQKND